VRSVRPYTYLATARGMCRECRQIVPARIVEQDGSVYQERLCSRCGHARALIAQSATWYRRVTSYPVAIRSHHQPPRPVTQGCPQDCGPCAFHAARCHLPVFSITNACNMACPICFTYNRPDRVYHMPREELARVIDHVIAQSRPLDLINITGGEPTIHPELLDLLAECHRPEIGRVTVNSNGLRIGDDSALCERLAEAGVCIVLSLDTLDPQTSRAMHGRDVVAIKIRALENLQRHGIPTTLLHVMARGVNDSEVGKVVELAKAHSVVRSMTVQTMTFTGQGGGTFEPRRHMPLDAAAAALEQGTGGQVRADHFFPHPSAHPLCYSIAYYLRGTPLRSFTDFLSLDELRGMFGGGYLLDAGDAGADAFGHAIDRLWAEGGDADLLGRLKSLVGRVYPGGKPLNRFERQRAAEPDILTLYLHSHMDEDTLDLGRLCACPDLVPDAQGRMIPACAYNLFYRRRDPRFWGDPKAAAHPEESCC